VPEESTNTDSRATTRTPPAIQEVDVSSVQDWEPGLKAYGAGLLDPETLVKLLAATEIAVFEAPFGTSC